METVWTYVIWAGVVLAAWLCTVGIMFWKLTRREPYPLHHREWLYRKIEKSPLAEWVPVLRRGADWLNDTPYDDAWVLGDDGQSMHARLFLHRDQLNEGRLMILCHGYHSDPEVDFGASAEEYYNAGMHLLVIDQRAHGDSEGERVCFGVKEGYDIRNWCWYVRREYPKMEIVLCGVSMGATAVLRAAAMPNLPRNVIGVIADSAYTNPYREFQYVLRRHGCFLPGIFLGPLRLVCRKWAKFDMRAFDTTQEVPKITVPVLFVHGEADKLVPPSCTRANYDACTSPKTLLMVPGAGHAVSWLADQPRYREVLHQFLQSLPDRRDLPRESTTAAESK